MLLLANNVGAMLGDAGMTVLIGFTVVFLVLLLLTGVFKLFGMLMSGTEKETASVAPAAPAAPVAAPAAAAPIVGNTAEVRTVPEVQNGIPEETVAVISAAVASVTPAGSQYAVRGIRKM